MGMMLGDAPASFEAEEKTPAKSKAVTKFQSLDDEEGQELRSRLVLLFVGFLVINVILYAVGTVWSIMCWSLIVGGIAYVIVSKKKGLPLCGSGSLLWTCRGKKEQPIGRIAQMKIDMGKKVVKQRAKNIV